MLRYYTLAELEKRILGRCKLTEEDALALSWSASGFECRVRASRICLYFVPDYKADQPAYIGLELDGEMRKFAVSTGAEVAVIDGLEDLEHTLRVLRLSEGDRLLKCLKLELYGEEPEVLAAPEVPELRFEAIGDSITCGYGDLGDRSVNAFRTHEEDPTKTYAYLAAKALGAEYRAESISGQGIVKNCNGDVGYRIPCFFEHELRVEREAHDFTSWIPQIVVINAGTNDCGGQVSPEDFAHESGIFLDRIRELYPDAQIFWVYGMMGLRYDSVLAEVIAARDEKTHYVPIRPIYEFDDNVGANGHPNENGQARAAEILVEAIKNALSAK